MCVNKLEENALTSGNLNDLAYGVAYDIIISSIMIIIIFFFILRVTYSSATVFRTVSHNKILPPKYQIYASPTQYLGHGWLGGLGFGLLIKRSLV